MLRCEISFAKSFHENLKIRILSVTPNECNWMSSRYLESEKFIIQGIESRERKLWVIRQLSFVSWLFHRGLFVREREVVNDSPLEGKKRVMISLFGWNQNYRGGIQWYLRALEWRGEKRDSRYSKRDVALTHVPN